MNFIQKAWLVALKPVIAVVNGKMATRSGLIGRFGRFFAFGPREFGYHPINRWFSYVNQQLVLNIGLLMHRYSFMKGLTMNGYNYFRSHMFASLLGPFVIIFNMIYLALPSEACLEDGTSLSYLQQRLPFSPVNALNHRISAHFTEINSMYGAEMMKKFVVQEETLTRERGNYDDEVKKTRYARPGYKYIKAHSDVKE